MSTYEQRIEKLRTLPEGTQERYGSLETARLITKLIEKHKLERGGPIVDVVGDTILEFQQERDLAEIITAQVGVAEEIGVEIANEILAYIKSDGSGPEVKPGSTLPAARKPDLKERLHLRPENMKNTPSKKEAFSGPKSQPLTRDELLKSLSGARTMAKDIQAAKGPSESVKNNE